MNFVEKSILITGANRGIGPALAVEEHRGGAKRVYAGIRGALDISDERVIPILLDVTNADQIHSAAKNADSLDVLINNADISPYDDLSNTDAIDQSMAVNLYGTFNVTRVFLPLLRLSKGAVVNNLFLLALAPLPSIPSYSISKAVVFNMTQSLRVLLAGQGVTVHGVLLGPVDIVVNRGLDIPEVLHKNHA